MLFLLSCKKCCVSRIVFYPPRFLFDPLFSFLPSPPSESLQYQSLDCDALRPGDIRALVTSTSESIQSNSISTVAYLSCVPLGAPLLLTFIF